MSFSYVDSWIEEKTLARDSSALLEYQLGRVNETLSYAKKNSGFYAERFKHINCEITGIEELQFTFPNDIEDFAAEMLCVGQGLVSRVVTLMTSGTTGQSKRLFFSENDLAATIDFFRHGMMEFTSEGDTVLIMFPGNKDGSIGRLLAASLKELGAKPIIYGIAADFRELFGIVSDTRINVIAGLPQQLLEFSRLCRYGEIAVDGLHSVLLSADYVAEAVVEAIKKNFGCVVYEHYGMTEMCFGGGVYSKALDGYHMRHNDYLFEIVDPKTGAALPPGEYGEIVFTSLNTGAMPLFRYRTGDYARFIPRSEKYPVMERIKGRISGGIRLANGKILTQSAFEEALFAEESVLDFRAEYCENTLKLYVRSLSFDAGSIIKTLRNSVAGELFDVLTVKILPMGDYCICNNTMNKRYIKVFSQ